MASYYCPRCGKIEFKNVGEYELHQIDFHGIKLPIRSRNESGRSSLQIVKDAESSWLKPFILEGNFILTDSTNEEKHLTACMCHQCLATKLNDMLRTTQKELEEIKLTINIGGY